MIRVQENRVPYKNDNTVWVRFADGLEGIDAFLPSVCRGVSGCLQDPEALRFARIEDGVLTRPGELNLAPDAIHAAIAALTPAHNLRRKA